MRGQSWLATALAAAMLVAAVEDSAAKKADRHRSHGVSCPPPAHAARSNVCSVPASAPASPAENASGAGNPPSAGNSPSSVLTNAAPASGPPNPTDEKPAAVAVDKQDVQTILGKNVRSSAGEDMGHLVDVVVDRDGRTVAAVIDFGGFLGVGSRKIAVDWKALHFSFDDPKGNTITLALTRDQVKAAPEYKDAAPVVILGALGSLQTVPSPPTQEK